MSILKPKKEALKDLVNDLRKIRQGIHFAKNTLADLNFTDKAQDRLVVALFMLQRAIDMVVENGENPFVDPDVVEGKYEEAMASKLLFHARGQVLELSSLLVDVLHNVNAPANSTFRILLNGAFLQLTEADYFILSYVKPFMNKSKMEVVTNGK